MTDDRDQRHNEKMRRVQAARRTMMESKTVERGLLIVHTGAGKGKSTAAFGMAVRAMGHGMKVGVVQFVKGAMTTGEKAIFDAFPDLIEFRAMGEGFTWDTQDRARDVAAARAAWDEVQRMLADPAIAMVIADELNIVLRYDYLPVDEVVAVATARAPMKHLVITGRNAPDALIEAADLVTEMTQVKHPFRDGVKAQAGVEF
ncbi:cob(I)yrinic acid a,c-diamide adenosyltransferase [Sphingomonas sp. Leaf231]|uniref:cob(I)yrinic acid a,c-diamide adenosyltransferase n=1 Tax=Sphingomonas sp. Leaf231 TaxID=1736301 RepID=UPI0006F78719|nr:cob(I)yrinic acid a,c-diamide adenosyltransferase [Sphingomonas sp. Leaf231]KQN93264.1 cob(I)yrinic acid a,c-diamide adenosyltransferase [Sphingomonas sp. Leaf231]